MSAIRRVCVVGTGVIGSGWAARCLARGLDVIGTDPGPGAGEQFRENVKAAWVSLERVGLAEGASLDRLSFTGNLEEALQGADFVQESAPENIELKRALHARMDAVLPASVLMASSSSGLLPSEVQADCRHPERVLIGHPFNPVYLLPLVELVPGQATATASIDAVESFYRTLGMRPLRVRKEVPGYVSDRLQEALWREALHMIADGVATTAEIDAAITEGPGRRWALMGTMLTYHLAGGEDGMRHFVEHFGPALELPWTHCPAPPMTKELSERLVRGTAEQARGHTVKALERRRDDFLIDLMTLREKYDL